MTDEALNAVERTNRNQEVVARDERRGSFGKSLG